jgi:ligand-binding sensor domain-containing protein
MKHLFTLVVLWSCGILSAQRFAFVNFNTGQGLPQSQVSSIVQDELGVLWVGTLGGIGRFNGKDFRSFTSETGLLNNRISCLTVLADKVWVGHEGGVSMIKGKKVLKWSFGRSNQTLTVTDILMFKGHLLVSTNGEGLFEISDGKIKRLPFSFSPIMLKGTEDALLLNTGNEDQLRIRDLHAVGGKLFLATRAGVLTTEDLRGFRSVGSLDGYSISSVQTLGKSIYVSTFGNGLFHMDLNNYSAIRRVKSIDPLLTIRKCLVAKEGELWLVTNDGVIQLRNEQLHLKLDQKSGLPVESIRCVFQDRVGAIWLGSEGKGLLRFSGEHFLHYSRIDGLASDLIISFAQKKDGSYWLGTFDNGVMHFSPEGTLVHTEFDNSSTVWAILTDFEGSDWFGTEHGLVQKRGPKKKIYFAENGLPGDKVSALFKINRGTFLVGGSEGVSIYSEGVFKMYMMKEPSTVRGFCKAKGKIYCVADNGFYEIKNKQLIRISEFNRTAYSIVADDYGQVWIGTEEGLFRYVSGKITSVQLSETASSNYVNFLVPGKQGLFVGTNNGVFFLSNLKKMTPKLDHFGISEGIIDLETNINSGYLDRSGILWFGTASGLVRYDKRLFKALPKTPALNVKNMLVNYLNNAAEFGERINSSGFPAVLDLPFAKNNLTIEFEGIDLDNYNGLRFQYWMEGLDQGWSPLTNNALISFNGLPSGSYVLHARSVDAEGRFSEEFVLPIDVRVPFYYSWWFLILVIICFSALGWWLINNQLKREREKVEREKLELRSRLLHLEQRSLNASMNRHFIFNSLNSIQYFINTQDKVSANRYLTNFARLIRKNLDSSDEGNLVSLQQELERLELYLSLEAMRFNNRFDYSIYCDPSIDTEAVIIPALMIQPFIENSIIHGILPNEERKGKIELEIKQHKESLTIRVGDNGVGVDLSLKNKRESSGDHESKGTEITLKRIELLKKLTHKDFQLIGPRQVFNDDGLIAGTEVLLKFIVESLE